MQGDLMQAESELGIAARVRWPWGVGVLLCAGSATAAAAATSDGPVTVGALDSSATGIEAEALDETVRVDAGPRLAIELGRSPTQRGYAVDISGGAPRSRALLSFAAEGGPARRSFVALDEHGEARLVERNASAGPLRVACAIVPPSGSSPARVVVRTATLDVPPVPPAANAVMAPGDVVISEIMKDPQFVSDTAGEWFEIRNRSAQPIDLHGWSITDAGSNSHVIQGSGNGLWLMPRQYFVLGINADPNLNGGITVHYRYTNFTLANGADEIRLSDAAGNLVDVVAYDDGIFWPDDAGKSLSLSRSQIDAVLNDDGNNWCPALSPILGSFDFGTPKLANNNCP